MPVLSSLPPTKKRKTSHAANIEHIEEALTSALSKSASLNPLADLTSLAATLTNSQDLHKAIYALYRVFALIIDSNRFCSKNEEGEEAKVVRSWLNERLTEYTAVLCKCLKNDQKGIRVRSNHPWILSHPNGFHFQTSALEILFSILKHLSESFSKTTSQPQFHVSYFRKVVNGILIVDVDDGRLDPDVRDHFLATWFSIHDDVRWFFLRESSYVLEPIISRLVLIGCIVSGSFYVRHNHWPTLISQTIYCPFWSG